MTKTLNNQANSGGAANELGSQYRAELTAWIVAHGLADRPIPTLTRLLDSGVPETVALESDRVPDDVVVITRTGQEIRIQAKRTLSLSKKSEEFQKLVQQLVAGAKGMVGTNGRLVIATSPTGPIQALANALDKNRAALSAPLTNEERRTLNIFTESVRSWDPAMVDEVLRRTDILLLSPNGATTHRDAAVAHLESAVVAPGHGEQAFERLMALARILATKRIGWGVDDWLMDLHTFGIPLRSTADGNNAERRVATFEASERYYDACQANAGVIELRDLGIPLTPLSTDIDQKVEVEGGTRPHLDLCETVRRYSRVILVGLPGSGKSTALSSLAASEVGETRAFPLRVQLSRLKSDFSDLDARMLELALDASPVEDRLLLSEHARREIAQGRAIWLLDGLDECIGWHTKAVAALEKWSRTAISNCDVVITTRDATFASAKTLGWPSLRLQRPLGLQKTVVSLAKHYAETNNIADISAWADHRTQEVRELLERENDLVETPLIAILLTYQACVHTTGLLKTRGRILKAVVDDFVRKWEHPRSQQLGSLAKDQAPLVLIDAFVVLGRTVPSTNGVLTRTVDEALQDMLITRWGMPVRAARATAEDIRNVWDQAGFFPAVGAPSYVTARLRPFLDLAQAMAAIDGTSTERTTLFEKEKRDVLELAASLDQDLANDVVARAVETRNGSLLAIAADSQLEWLDARALLSLASCLVSRPWNEPRPTGVLGVRPNYPDWIAIKKIAQNPVAKDVAQDLRQAICKLPEPARSVASAFLEENLGNSDALNVALDDIAALDSTRLGRHGVWQEGLELVARHLLPSRPELAPLLARHASESIEQQLLRHGHEGLFRTRFEMAKKWFKDDDQFVGFFSEIEKHRDSSSTWRQRRQLAEIAALFEIITPSNATGIHPSNAAHRQTQDFSEIVDTCMALVATEPGVLGDQAAIVLERLKASGRRIVGSLWELGHVNRPKSWPTKLPIDVMLEKLVQWLGRGRWRRTIAARALEVAPNSLELIKLLGKKMSRLPVPARVHAVWLMCHHSSDHVARAATLSCARDPVVRGEAGAHLAHAFRTGEVSCRTAVERMLCDVDLGVRSRTSLYLEENFWQPDFDEARNIALTRIAESWTCLSCGHTQTPPGSFDPRMRDQNRDLSCNHCHITGIRWPPPIEAK